ncbi:MAG: hypothetical protein ACOCXT_02185 [Candidatus Dojkabacteria bacterium]
MPPQVEEMFPSSSNSAIQGRGARNEDYVNMFLTMADGPRNATIFACNLAQARIELFQRAAVAGAIKQLEENLDRSIDERDLSPSNKLGAVCARLMNAAGRFVAGGDEFARALRLRLVKEITPEFLELSTPTVLKSLSAISESMSSSKINPFELYSKGEFASLALDDMGIYIPKGEIRRLFARLLGQ